LSQANIEDTFLDVNINQLMLPEEVHLRGMTVYSKSKKYCGEYDRNICTKNEVGKFSSSTIIKYIILYEFSFIFYVLKDNIF